MKFYYVTKAEVKKVKRNSRTTVKGVYTEEELIEVWGTENAERFKNEAVPY